MRGLVLLVAVLVVAAQATHLVELKRREVPVEEQHQILQLLQMDSGTGEVPNVKLNTNFFGTIEIGEHEQQFEVVFDTGSDALWVYSDSCTSCKSAHKHTFNRKGSKSYHRKSTPFSIKYGTGESHGTTGTDNMELGDLEVQAQVFGQCDQPDEVMRGFPFDGIVGLSRPMYMDPNGLVPIMETVKKEGLLKHKDLANTFSFYLGREDNEKSFLIFGGSHHMLHEGAVHWVPTLSKNIFWELPLDDVLVHKKEGGDVSLKKYGHALERHLHSHVMHDAFAEMMTDPFAHPPKAENITVPPPPSHSSHSNHKRHAVKQEEDEGNDDLPGFSEDGYPFTTKAEPITALLELEDSIVSMLELETEHKVHHLKPHHKAPSFGLHHDTNAAHLKPVHHAQMGQARELERHVSGKDAVKRSHKHSNPPAPHAEAHSVHKKTAHNHATKHAGAHYARDMEEEGIVDTLVEVVDKVDPFDLHSRLNSIINKEDKQAVAAHPKAAKAEAPKASVPTTHVATKAANANANAPTTSSSKGAKGKKDSGVVGSGELLSDFPTTPGVSINPCRQDATHPCVVSMDSGHSLISGPPELVRALKQYTMPPGACNEEETANMPDVSFVIGGKLFTLTPMDYLIELEGQCTPAFRERPYRNGHDWVLGEHFMRTFYAVFDYDDMRVGLARLDNIKEHLDTILTPAAHNASPNATAK